MILLTIYLTGLVICPTLAFLHDYMERPSFDMDRSEILFSLVLLGPFWPIAFLVLIFTAIQTWSDRRIAFSEETSS